MSRNPMINTTTGQRRVIRKKSELTGSGKGEWYRFSQCDEQYKKNYDRIFGKRDIAVENKVIADESDIKIKKGKNNGTNG